MKRLPQPGSVVDNPLVQSEIEPLAAMPGESGIPAAAGATDGFFRKLLDAAPDAMVIVDGDGRIIIVNAAAEQLFGYTRQQLLGACIEMLVPERFRDGHRAQRKSYGAAPKIRRMGVDGGFVGRRSDGSEFPVEIGLSPVDASSGVLVVSTIRDITKRDRIDHELKVAREVAEHARKANTAFLSAASHDLRQPVQALQLLTGALQRTVTDPLALEMIERQRDSLDSMTNLLNSLLDISRLDAGALEPRIEDFPLNNLIERLEAEFSRQAQQKKLDFHADRCNQSVRSDPNLLGEIIQNFISNAVRYTRQGSVHLGYTVRGDELSIEVRDSGIGIPADQLDKIFLEFYQIRHDGRKKEGVGLGLSIARRLADLLGHSIDVESTPEGSCFSVRVPIVAASGNVATRGHKTDRNAPKPGGFIVIVEDDVRVAQAWQLLLRTEGYRVAGAATASEVSALIEDLDEPPDLILSDFYLLDGSNGVDAVRAVREALGSCIPAFIVTGDTSKIIQEIHKLENCRILRKPVRPDELLRLARMAIEEGLCA